MGFWLSSNRPTVQSFDRLLLFWYPKVSVNSAQNSKSLNAYDIESCIAKFGRVYCIKMINHTIQPESAFKADIEKFRQEFIAIFLRWSFIIVLFCTIVFLWVFIQDSIWTAGVLLVTFIQFLPSCLLCFWLVGQGRSQLATWAYLVSGLIAATSFTLFMPNVYLIVGMVGYILFIRVTMFLEARKAAYALGGICAVLYLTIIFIRNIVFLPPVQLGELSNILVSVLPILILILFAFLDQLGTRYLQTALQLSEKARLELGNSYIALTDSEDALSKLANNLEKRNRELHQVNEELKSFAYIISHDLRAPLINLKGFSSELREAMTVIQPAASGAELQLSDRELKQFHQALEEDVPEALAFIESSVTRMDSLINALLQLSRYGRREMVFEPIDMNEIVQTTLESLAHQTAEKKVAITIADLPVITADYVSFELIIGNLLSNALNYLQPDRPGQIKIWAEEHQSETWFHIQDNGRGIAPNDMPKLFEPFRRIGNDAIPGEGMGLAYVQTLVRRHSGRIWCDSELGIGSAFIFTVAKPSN
jgi:signal transduction histidine kinase